MVTAYDYPTALHADRAGADIVLVGDSLGMVVLGHATTQPVTLADMLHHTAAARRGTRAALLVADLPFGAYEVCEADAVRASVRLVKEAGADAVKLEGAAPARARAIRAVVDAGVAVMAHVGLTPQAVSVAGGFRAVGRDAGAAARVLDEALAAQDAGAFAVVIECVPAGVAQAITEKLSIPTVGIGSGAYCRGQVLVYHDMLGVMAHPHHDDVAPRFSKKYARIGELADHGIREFAREVRANEFPSDRYSPYKIPLDQLELFRRYADQVGAAREKAAADSQFTPSGGDDDGNIRLY
jgi:3-methyl-2-oxobutanoate hydroxymethyltransferase